MSTYVVRKELKYGGQVYKRGTTITSDEIGNERREVQLMNGWIMEAPEAPSAEEDGKRRTVVDIGTVRKRGRPPGRR